MSNTPSEEWKETQDRYIDTLHEDVKRYLYSYTSYGYQGINRRLRKDIITNEDKDFQEAIFNAPTTDKNIVLFRLSKDIDYIEENIFFSKGFMSCTDRYNIVVKEAIKSKKYIIQVRLPEGFNLLYYSSRESEYILPHGIHFKVSYSGLLTYILNNEAYEIYTIILNY